MCLKQMNVPIIDNLIDEPNIDIDCLVGSFWNDIFVYFLIFLMQLCCKKY